MLQGIYQNQRQDVSVLEEFSLMDKEDSTK